MSRDIGDALAARVQEAAHSRQPVQITGNGTRSALGRASDGDPVAVHEHSGILHYEPTELVVTARAGTQLEELEDTLAGEQQMLPFEPPRFGPKATLGGTVACGLAGPRRPWTGAVRDFVLGSQIINGKGETLHFGGEVMKNVAGYDVSRLMAGSWGTLGIISSVSLKVLPLPESEASRSYEISAPDALRNLAAWSRSTLPLSGAVWFDGRLFFRLSGTGEAVAAAVASTGGDSLDDDAAFWKSIREHEHRFFAADLPLWRLSLPSATPWLELPGEQLIDWGGAQRWLKTQAGEKIVRSAVETAGGHATCFRGGDRSGQIFHPLSPVLRQLHTRLKQAFDPYSILNPGRMYAGL